MVEEGGFEYDCNAYNDDLPYYTNVNGGKWLVIPYSLEVNDYGFWRGQLSTPSDFFESARNSFDTLYREGATHPKMMSVGAPLPYHWQTRSRRCSAPVSGVRQGKARRVVPTADRHSKVVEGEVPLVASTGFFQPSNLFR